MHPEACAGFQLMLKLAKFGADFDPNHLWHGLDVGGRNVNGSVRAELPGTEWTGLDLRPGPDVDIVADAATWIPSKSYDIVIATELFEHTQTWREIIHTMWLALDKSGPGIFISTCASTGRSPHGASGEWGVPADQWYENVDPIELELELRRHFRRVFVEFNPNPGDAYALALEPRGYVGD